MYQEMGAGYWYNHLREKVSHGDDYHILENIERFGVAEVASTFALHSKNATMAWPVNLEQIALSLRQFATNVHEKIMIQSGQYSWRSIPIDVPHYEQEQFRMILTEMIVEAEKEETPLQYITLYRLGTYGGIVILRANVYRTLDFLYRHHIIGDLFMAELCADLLAAK